MKKGNILINTSEQWGDMRRVRHYQMRRQCSRVRKICTTCQRVSIHPNDLNFESGVCKRCSAQGATPPRTPVEARSKSRPALSESSSTARRPSASRIEIKEWSESFSDLEDLEFRERKAS